MYFVFLARLRWEEFCEKQEPFDVYFGIVKLSHSYTMMMDVSFDHTPVRLDTIMESQSVDGCQLKVTELLQSEAKTTIRYQIEVAIDSETVPGPFYRRFQLVEASTTNVKKVTIQVRGKILRLNQGTATLRPGVHMKSIRRSSNDDDD